MARFSKRDEKDTQRTPEEVETPVIAEQAGEESGIEESGSSSWVFQDDTGDSFEDFFKLDVSDGASSEDNSAIAENADDVEENTEMSTTEVQEVRESEVPTEVQPEANEDSLLSDAAKAIAEKVEPKKIEMLEISSIPPTLPHISSNLNGLVTLGEFIKTKVREWEAGSGGKDEKVKFAVENLTPDSDPENYQRRERAAALKQQIAELEAEFDEVQEKLYEEVEKKLVASGDEVWSDEKIQTERDVIRDMYSNYTTMFKGTAMLVDSHRKTKPGDKLGAIEQYVSKLDKPFSRVKSDGSTSTGSGTGSRNVFVNSAEVSFDGGKTFTKIENDKGNSNVAVLSAEIARSSKDTQADLRDRIYANYYAEAGFTAETANNVNMPEVVTFDLIRTNKASKELETIKIRLKKRVFAQD
jgi:hypothetical protein